MRMGEFVYCDPFLKAGFDNETAQRLRDVQRHTGVPARSVIAFYRGQIETQLEGEVLRAVQKCGVVVDKDELLKALAYDRDQYEQGYKDAMESIIHCRICKNFTKVGYEQDNEHEDDLDLHMGYCYIFGRDTQACRFCSYGRSIYEDD